jgi:hypothetical protein
VVSFGFMSFANHIQILGTWKHTFVLIFLLLFYL